MIVVEIDPGSAPVPARTENAKPLHFRIDFESGLWSRHGLDNCLNSVF